MKNVNYKELDDKSNVLIVYFSGTGCTELVAKSLHEQLSTVALSVELKRIQDYESPARSDFLVICFPVHAFNPPKPVLDWVRDLKQEFSTSTILISVSGGGSVTPNLACRLPLVRSLKRLGYNVVYEEMIVMPSNWITSTDVNVGATLLEVLPSKLSKIVHNLKEAKSKRVNPGLLNRLITFLGRSESIGAKRFGENIYVKSSCISCGLCVNTCPVMNISFKSKKPVFGLKCIMCLGCIYTCPTQALQPKVFNSVALNEGFSLKTFKASKPISDIEEIKNKTRGFLWLGVRRYLIR